MAGRACWYVYVVRCSDGTLYTGATTDPHRRVAQHNARKGARYTRSRAPVQLVHVERLPDRGAALRREALVKGWSRADKLALVEAAARRSASAVEHAPRPAGRATRT